MKKGYTPFQAKSLFHLLAFFFFSALKAQVFYSTDPHYLKSKKEGDNLAADFKYNYPDSSITNFSQFQERNFLGNTGLPSPDYLLRYGTADLGFRFYEVPSRIDKFYDKQVEYYTAKGPYAKLTGILGDKQLQIFRMIYTQSYKEKLNVTLRFNRYTSLGYYGRQQSFVNNFYGSSHSATKNKRLGYYLYVLSNGNKNQENGGISDVVLSDKTVSLNKDLLAVRTHSATRDNRELKVMLNPWMRLNSGTDSVTGPQHFLQLKSNVVNNSYKYKDTNAYVDRYYKTCYYDTVSTRDTSHLRQYINEVNYTVKQGARFAFSAGYRNEINKLWQRRDSVFTNHGLQAGLFIGGLRNSSDTASVSSYELRANSQYIFKGPNSGNYKLEANAIFWLSNKAKRYLYFDALAEDRSADYIFNTWNSNHFLWSGNNYKTQQKTEARLGLNMGSVFSCEVHYQNMFRYLYFDQYALPRQYNKTIENLGLTLNFTKILFRHLGITFSHTYQGTSHTTYVRLPQNITSGGIFYNGNLFRNNLQLQLGSRVQIYQSFLAYGYTPATQAFYLQEQYTTAACPFLDVYLNARVRPVSIFVKLENALQGLVGNNYSFVPGYYQTDRALRFGISWVFFD